MLFRRSKIITKFLSRKRRDRKETDQVQGYEADIEESEVEKQCIRY